MRGFDGRKFANVMGYHAKYFQAQSYWQLGSSLFKKANDEGRGMALSIANLTVCVEKFNEAKPFADMLGGGYQSNFTTKAAEAQ